MNSTHRTYMIGCTSFALPLKSLVIVKKMKPAAIPSAMLYANGIQAMVINAGSALSNSPQLMFLTLAIISTPTIIRTGAVAAVGTRPRNGEATIATRNSTPVVKEVRPVRPPSETPAEDSTKVVTVEVPRTAPQAVAIASASRWLLAGCPLCPAYWRG